MSGLLPVEIEVIQHEWLWDLKALCVKSPSVAAGMSWTEEVYTRADGVHSIIESGLHFLKPMPHAIYISAAYLHRFYSMHSLQEFPIREIAVTCLFLGCKMADESRRLTHVVTAFMTREATLRKVDTKISEATPEHKELVRKVIYYEDVLLRTLGYDLGVDQPQAYAIAAMDRIFGSSQIPPPVWDGRPGVEKPAAWYVNAIVWELLGMSFYSPICILVPPNVTAAAAIFLACRWGGADMARAFEAIYQNHSGEDIVTDDWNSLLQTQRKYVEWTASLMMDTMVLLPDQERTREMRRRTEDVKPDPNLPNLFGEYPNGTAVATNGTSVPPAEESSRPMETDEQPVSEKPEVPITTQETPAANLASAVPITTAVQATSSSATMPAEVPIGAQTIPYQPDQQPAATVQPSPVPVSEEAQQDVPAADAIAHQADSGELPAVNPSSAIDSVLPKQEPVEVPVDVAFTQIPQVAQPEATNQPQATTSTPSLPAAETAAAPIPLYPFIAVPSPRRSQQPKEEAPTSLANLLNSPGRAVEEEERLRVEGGEMKDELLRPKAEDTQQEIHQSAAQEEALVKVEENAKAEVVEKVDQEKRMYQEPEYIYEL